MNITVLPPDPRLNGWPVPIGVREDLPDWLRWVCSVKLDSWRVLNHNCFQRRQLLRHR
jgi:hypothetical protein